MYCIEGTHPFVKGPRYLLAIENEFPRWVKTKWSATQYPSEEQALQTLSVLKREAALVEGMQVKHVPAVEEITTKHEFEGCEKVSVFLAVSIDDHGYQYLLSRTKSDNPEWIRDGHLSAQNSILFDDFNTAVLMTNLHLPKNHRPRSPKPVLMVSKRTNLLNELTEEVSELSKTIAEKTRSAAQKQQKDIKKGFHVTADPFFLPDGSVKYYYMQIRNHPISEVLKTYTDVPQHNTWTDEPSEATIFPTREAAQLAVEYAIAGYLTSHTPAIIPAT